MFCWNGNIYEWTFYVCFLSQSILVMKTTFQATSFPPHAILFLQAEQIWWNWSFWKLYIILTYIYCNIVVLYAYIEKYGILYIDSWIYLYWVHELVHCAVAQFLSWSIFRWRIWWVYLQLYIFSSWMKISIALLQIRCSLS